MKAITFNTRITIIAGSFFIITLDNSNKTITLILKIWLVVRFTGKNVIGNLLVRSSLNNVKTYPYMNRYDIT